MLSNYFSSPNKNKPISKSFLQCKKYITMQYFPRPLPKNTKIFKILSKVQWFYLYM